MTAASLWLRTNEKLLENADRGAGRRPLIIESAGEPLREPFPDSQIALATDIPFSGIISSIASTHGGIRDVSLIVVVSSTHATVGHDRRGPEDETPMARIPRSMKRRRSLRPGFEALEGRRLLSSTPIVVTKVIGRR